MGHLILREMSSCALFITYSSRKRVNVNLTGGESFGVQLQYSGFEVTRPLPRLLPNTSPGEGPWLANFVSLSEHVSSH